MTAIRIWFDRERQGPVFRRSLYRKADQVRTAARATADDVAQQIVKLGQSDISRAGNFGTRWTEGLHADVTQGGGNIRISVTHDVPYFSVFEYGKVIEGKPMLWIPLEFAETAKGVRARDYPNPLVRVDRKAGGAPLLLDIGVRPAVPTYFGKESVTIPQKFHIRDIAKEAARRMREVFLTHYTSG